MYQTHQHRTKQIYQTLQDIGHREMYQTHHQDIGHK